MHQHTHTRVCVFSSKPQSVDRVNIIICSLSSRGDNGLLPKGCDVEGGGGAGVINDKQIRSNQNHAAKATGERGRGGGAEPHRE